MWEVRGLTVRQKWESAGVVLVAQLYVLLNVWLLHWTIFKQNSNPRTAVTAEEVLSLLQFFFFYSFFLFCFLENLVIFLSFFFKGHLVCFVLPEGNSGTWLWVPWEANCCPVPSHPWEQAPREHQGLGRDVLWGPVELTGQEPRERMCRNVSGLKAWKLEALQLGNWE